VASFRSGYVRNQNSAYSNYQLNKQRKYPPTKWSNGYEYSQTYRELIPIEIDRLEYLISYCLKNYYIKRANQVVEGKYVSQWYHDWSLERANETYSENTGAMARINDLEEKLDAMTEDRDNKSDRIYELESQVDVADTRVTNLKLQYEVLQNKLSNAISATKHQCTVNKLHDLENKLATINRISDI